MKKVEKISKIDLLTYIVLATIIIVLGTYIFKDSFIGFSEGFRTIYSGR